MKSYIDDELKYNLYNYSKTKKRPYMLILSLIIAILTLTTIFFHIDYEVKIKSLTVDENIVGLKFYQSYDKPYKIEKIKISKKVYELENITYGDIQADSNNNLVQEVIIRPKDYDFKNNEIVEISLIDSKKSLFKLIAEIIKKG